MVAYRLDIKAGDWIDNKYKVVDKIGSGSYGHVFKVEDLCGNCHALKLLRLWEVSGELHESLIKKFEQEYKTGQLASEYLIHSIDFGTCSGNPYFLMEFCERGDLSGLIGQDLSQLPGIAHDILEGLHVLHTAGKIHRDMKPENVLLRNNGKAALTDFGVVGEMEQSKRSSEVGWWKKRPRQIQGSPLYMAPEMADRVGGGVTYLPTVDIWSFGIMMYEILTGGHFPFGTIDTVEKLPAYREKSKKGEWDSERLVSVPGGDKWVHLIARCLAPNFRDRYQSAVEVMAELKPLIGTSEPLLPTKHDTRSPLLNRIVVTQGENTGTRFYLARLLSNNRKMLRAGRDQQNDIVLPANEHTYVSRAHFTLQKAARGNTWIIRDGQWLMDKKRWEPSTNGTYLNSTPVSQEGLKLFTGDIITAGEYKLKVE